MGNVDWLVGGLIERKLKEKDWHPLLYHLYIIFEISNTYTPVYYEKLDSGGGDILWVGWVDISLQVGNGGHIYIYELYQLNYTNVSIHQTLTSPVGY